ncbi:glycosyltransferase family 4 protein [Sulfuricurvum sp.]|uniref:glycosyltransferase family 4 protein n=1 Tax=Sulfuricurvum sp. TaxID=2025608 RepID=UPI003567277F
MLKKQEEDVKTLFEENAKKYRAKFEEIVSGSRDKNEIEINHILFELSTGLLEKRMYYNYFLAEHYFGSNNAEQAKVFVERAWFFSHFNTDILPLYLQIHESIQDFEAIREAYKRAGMEESKKSNIVKAITYFNKWHYTDATYKKVDMYQYDFDIMDAIERMAKPYKYTYDVEVKEAVGKTKIAFLIFGITHSNSALIKMNKNWLKYSNLKYKTIEIFVVDSKRKVENSQEAMGHIDDFKLLGCEVRLFDDMENKLERLLNISKSIHGIDADVLITGAAMAEFEHIFILATHPAKKTAGFLYGPPEQFCYPFMDEVVGGTFHSLLDAPSQNNIYKQLIFDKQNMVLSTCSKQDIGLPENSIVLMSFGRYTKFQDHQFWKTIVILLKEYSDVYFLVAGPIQEQIPDMLESDIADRIKFFGWINNIQDYLHYADVVLDTYPSGGGLTIKETMEVGIPIVVFENDFKKKYNQNNWSLAYELVGVHELVVERGDFKAWKELVSKLIVDFDFRNAMGKKCREYFDTFLKRKNVLGRIACLGQSVFNLVYKNNASIFLTNQQKVRCDIFMEFISDNRKLPKTDVIKDFIIHKDIIPLIRQQEEFLWMDYINKKYDFEYLIIDSFAELAEQKFTHKKEGWIFSCYYNQLEHSEEFEKIFECNGLLPIENIKTVYAVFFDWYNKIFPNKKIIFIHFSSKFDSAEKFKNRAAEILKGMEEIAVVRPYVINIAIDDSHIFQHEDGAPYHYRDETNEYFANLLKKLIP